MFHVFDDVFFPQLGLMEFVQGKISSLGGHLGNTLESFFLVMQIQLLAMPSKFDILSLHAFHVNQTYDLGIVSTMI